MVKQQQSILVGGFQSKSAEVDFMTKGKPRRKKHEKHKEKIPPSTTPQSKHQSKCPRFLGSFHPKKTCPPRSSKCNKCSKRGHWAQACRGSKPIKLPEVEAETGRRTFLPGRDSGST